MADVETALQRSPVKSSRKLAVWLGMSHSSAWRTAREFNFPQFKMADVYVKMKIKLTLKSVLCGNQKMNFI
ncbi:hypothetical protein TNCT_475221 [Trichonephila clavata]|uniref:Uncharacterized protein n=1 Tax=Trichonephila clavata TaxID=2740835 RepID=A0A8X6FEU3_TRICU|nr:hypothetical protein TNCT_475221 [Trichonephila clavata]